MNVLVVQLNESAGVSINDDSSRTELKMITLAGDSTAFASRRDTNLVLLNLDSTPSGVDGLEIYRMLREHSDIPVIGFMQQDGKPDGRPGLESGVRGHVEAPMTLQAFLNQLVTAAQQAKLEAEGPAHAGGSLDDILCRGDLKIDLRAREVHVGKRSVKLTRKEFDLLHYLASRPKAVVSRQQLMADIWGDCTAHALVSKNTRTIDTHVNSLRSKLGCRSWVETVRGVGFRFVL